MIARSKSHALPGIGRRIYAARQRAGLSQTQLAGEEMTGAYISRIEKGERVPSLDALLLIARRLKVNPMNLYFGNHARNCPMCGSRP